MVEVGQVLLLLFPSLLLSALTSHSLVNGVLIDVYEVRRFALWLQGRQLPKFSVARC